MNPGSTDYEADALTTTPSRRFKNHVIVLIDYDIIILSTYFDVDILVVSVTS